MTRNHLEKFIRPIRVAERLERFAKNKMLSKERRTAAFKTAQKIRACRKIADWECDLLCLNHGR